MHADSLDGVAENEAQFQMRVIDRLEAEVIALERSRSCISQEKELRGFRERYAALTSREREVMSLVVSGLLNKQIGARMRITETTVKAHRGKVMRKMAVDSLARLITVAGRLGFTPFAFAKRSAFDDCLLGLRGSWGEPNERGVQLS